MRRELLRSALLANAGFSTVTGLTALTLGGRLEEAFGPPAWSLRALGAGLLIFAAVVAREAGAPRRPWTRQIIAADLAWVVAAVAIVTIAPGWVTGTGRAALGAVTVVVGLLAVAQWRGLDR